ncbi:serine carboxypeptidase S28-domain-containing protein [Fomitopsis serialis]|uniref:serine carboxypeptidase S28-domain-containing protein n=1 Tax=Fomitopsis serialis TaxID=139415 RepID=UPI002007897A|nr:serine carboxypeptidase S28-domain-containing protein [Neoantrodia serialis]KAH9917352.1 serine carboxypeptidase S28-domain-containing protein [Neoantrodia serialis]
MTRFMPTSAILLLALLAVAIVDRNGTELPPLNTTYYFDQLIDHTNPSIGTFKQRYWHTWEFYEAGGPIILTTPGEGNAEGSEDSLVNSTINGMIAQELNGSTIVLEHRYYGYSNPYDNLSVESLQYHTIQQAIDDFEYIAYNVKLPMPSGDHVTPDEAPWILIGGSYAGALTSFTKVNKPDVFYAAWSSSGVVESIADYWGYFNIIRKHMPQNCSADVQAVIGHVDSVFTSGNNTAINEIKELFSMHLTHLDDFASALQHPLFPWQGLQPSSNLSDPLFFHFCDALEVKDNQTAPSEGWGLQNALNSWAGFWKEVCYQRYCDDQDAETCFGIYNASATYYTDLTVNNADRRALTCLDSCNQMGFYQDGAPDGEPTLVSCLIQPTHWEVNETNAAYHGWFIKADRLFFSNGEKDPWRVATVSADGTACQSTAMQPIVMGDGYHCSDMDAANGEVDSTIAAVQISDSGHSCDEELAGDMGAPQPVDKYYETYW